MVEPHHRGPEAGSGVRRRAAGAPRRDGCGQLSQRRCGDCAARAAGDGTHVPDRRHARLPRQCGPGHHRQRQRRDYRKGVPASRYQGARLPDRADSGAHDQRRSEAGPVPGQAADDVEPDSSTIRTGRRSKPIVDASKEAEKLPGVLAVSIPGGYQYGDVPAMGPSVIVITDNDPALAKREAERLGRSAVGNPRPVEIRSARSGQGRPHGDGEQDDSR